MEPPGLYIHVPFCSAICPYCDFAVLKDRPEEHARFVASVLAEARLRADEGWAEFETLYFGGGTPSALSAKTFEDLAAGLEQIFPNLGSARWHLEVNPEDVETERVAAWRARGVAFASLGVQSFDDDELKFLGRRHDGETARRAVSDLNRAGFETVSVDLIYGLPGRSLEDFEFSLQEAARSEAGHLSAYQLTIHEGTPFFRRRERGTLIEVESDLQAEFFLLAESQLSAAGFEAYEISNFSRGEEHQSRHNRKYWRHVPYLGLGPGAHSFDGERRAWNRRSLAAYNEAIENSADTREGEERLDASDLATEMLMLAMRTRAGLDLERFAGLSGWRLEREREEVIRRFLDSGHLKIDERSLRPTTAGMLIADRLALELTI